MTRVVRGGKTYGYDSFRFGSDVRKTYIGKETPALLERLDRLKSLRQETEERRMHRSRLLRILRAEGFQNVDAATGSLLSALGGAGVFRLGGTVVGTHAFRLYEGTLGVRYRFDDTAQTGDIEALKAEKDRLQATFLITVLAEDRPDELSEAYTDARNVGPQWRARLDATLERLPSVKTLLEAL